MSKTKEHLEKQETACDLGKGAESKYISTEKGLYIREDKGKRQISSPLEVVALTRDENGKNWGRLVRLTDPDGRVKENALPMTMISASGGNVLPVLNDLGLILANQGNKTKTDLIDYLANASTDDRVLCVTRPGWHNQTFVLGDKSFSAAGEKKDRVVLQTENSRSVHHGCKGTLDDWQKNIGQCLCGNSRLLTAVGAAFAVPLLDILNISDGGGFHFFGGSSIGKTTALQVAGSVWGGGGPNGYAHNWRTTDNSLEYLAEAHCDTLLCLDEIGQVDSRKVGEIAYMLANGEGKARSRREGGLKHKPQWRLLFLSTGEITLADKMSEGQQRTRAGQETRLVDIPADAGNGFGLFEETHGFESAADLANHLKTACGAYYGCPAVSFLEKLTSMLDKNQEAVVKFLGDKMGHFKDYYVPKEADGQVYRVADRFALVAAAGELATIMKIVPIEKDQFIWAAGLCFNQWLSHRGGIGSSERIHMLEQVRHFLATHQASRFIDGDTSSRNTYNLAGHIKAFTSGAYAGETVFAVIPEVFRKEICQGFNPKAVLEVLEEEDYLLTSGEKRPDMKVRIDGNDGRYVCISRSILASKDGDLPVNVDEPGIPGIDDGDF